MAKYEVRPKDYVDLSETYSEKNIINSVNGKEYVVNNVANTVINETTITTDIYNKIFNSERTTSENITQYYNPKFNSNILVNSSKNSNWVLGSVYARAEALFISGEYTFNTGVVIADLNSISIKFNLNYVESNDEVSGGLGDDGLNGLYSRYNIPNRTAFFTSGAYAVAFPHIEYDENKKPIVPQIKQTDKSISVSAGRCFNTFFDTLEATAPVPDGGQEGCWFEVLEATNVNTKVRVRYNFRIWGAWNNDDLSAFVYKYQQVAIAVTSIDITTMATSVDTNELSFEYPETTLRTTKRDYELETNELMQTVLGQAKEERLSYKTYAKIVDSYDTDRRIIMFDLLNPVKMAFDDNAVYEGASASTRYLDSNDIFSMYDEFDKYMGEFRVIQINPIWDGAYHKRITAILVD